MAAEDYERIAAALVPVPLGRDDILFKPEDRLSSILFIEEGIVSIIGRSDDRRVEVGMVGREGLAGVEAILGIDRSPYEYLVQLAGRAMKLDAGSLGEAINASIPLRDLLLRFTHVARVQAAETAVSNGSQTIDRRLARWLLMYRDRTDSDDVAVTHKFLAVMLGVRRAGITEAIHRLEGKRLLRARRSSLSILDRQGLERFAGTAYGLPEAEFRRLIPEGSPAKPAEDDRSGRLAHATIAASRTPPPR
jgi:CRP-like cAMP-binding protein